MGKNVLALLLYTYVPIMIIVGQVHQRFGGTEMVYTTPNSVTSLVS